MNRKITPHLPRQSKRSFILIPAFIVLVAGCSSNLKGATSNPPDPSGAQAASTHKPSTATYVSSSALPSQLTTANITDPSLHNMVSVTMTIPAGWSIQGVEMHPPCTPAPFPAYRASSPDGLMQIRQEPVLGWKWNPTTQLDQTGCAPIPGVLSAADFLKYYVGTMHGGVHMIGPMSVPASFSRWAQNLARQFNDNNAHLPASSQTNNTADTAALHVQVMNGSFIVDEQLLTGVECSVNTAGADKGGNCFARILIFSAPQGKLDALVHLADSNNVPRGALNPDWVQATLRQLSDKLDREGKQRLIEGQKRSAAFSHMMYDNFQQSMSRSASEHAQFMNQQESSFRSSMNNAWNSMNARTTAASDWVDYALDQQTVTGIDGTMKVSSAYSQTWSNGQGQWFQTNDVNSNPNGVLQGNWVHTAVVHGNGQPK